MEEHFGCERYHKKNGLLLVLEIEETNIWSNPWIPGIEGFRAVHRDKIDDLPSLLADLMMEDTKSWNSDLIHQVFEDDYAQALLQIPIPLFPRKDKMIWMCNNSGEFSVKSAFFLCNQSSSPRLSDHDGKWKVIWSAKIHNRLKTHFWRVVVGVLPTRVLASRIPVVDTICPLCNCD